MRLIEDSYFPTSGELRKTYYPMRQWLGMEEEANPTLEQITTDRDLAVETAKGMIDRLDTPCPTLTDDWNDEGHSSMYRAEASVNDRVNIAVSADSRDRFGDVGDVWLEIHETDESGEIVTAGHMTWKLADAGESIPDWVVAFADDWRDSQ
jgi:hypothetical protein